MKKFDAFGDSLFDIESERIEGERAGTTKYNTEAMTQGVADILLKDTRLT